MTTPAKLPDRMTDDELAFIADTKTPWDEGCAGIGLARLVAEARRARSEEERLSRQVEALWELVDVLAQAHGHAVGRWLGYREAAIRLACMMRFGRGLPQEPADWGFWKELSGLLGLAEGEAFFDGARRVVAERDAALEKATLDEQALDEACRHWHETEAELDTLERERDEALAAYAQAKLDTSDTARELAAARAECAAGAEALMRHASASALALDASELTSATHAAAAAELAATRCALALARDERDKLQEEAERLRALAKLSATGLARLWREMVESGNLYSPDFGWPTARRACEVAREELEKEGIKP